MPTLEELHNAYMKSRDLDDNYNIEDDYEAQKLNEYCNTKDDVSDIHWQPVARDTEFEKQILKLKAMQIFNKGK
jgi:hypothetical protein